MLIFLFKHKIEIYARHPLHFSHRFNWFYCTYFGFKKIIKVRSMDRWTEINLAGTYLNARKILFPLFAPSHFPYLLQRIHSCSKFTG